LTVELQGLSVDLGGRRIVSDIDLAVAGGEFAGLLGPNGSGKSTILKALYRVHPPSAGTMLLDGEDVLTIPVRAAARRVAVVAQEGGVEFALTVWEMVMLGRIPHKRSFENENERDRDLAAAALEQVGCTCLARQSFHRLSGGEKQRVLIARALAQEADHLILDEPTNHLDIRYQIEVLELVCSLGVTVLAALHDLSLAALFCNTVHLLADGRIVAAGSPTDVITVESIRAVYDADVTVVAHPDTGVPQPLARRPQTISRSTEERRKHA
jgi:iron complex transport system ATP-binding protein